MSFIASIDPGPQKSGFLIYDSDNKIITNAGKFSNNYLLKSKTFFSTTLVEVPDFCSSGVGISIIDTAIQAGIFIQYFKQFSLSVIQIGRKASLSFLEASNDATARKRLLEIYGKAFCKPISRDAWASLTVLHNYLNI